MNDPRFDTRNPLFKKSHSKRNKIKVDDRFQSVLHDKRFLTAPGKIDKYGRKVKSSVKSQQKELSEFYEIENIESQNKTGSAREVKSNKDESRLDYLTKLSRGEIDNDSSNDEHDSDVYEVEVNGDENGYSDDENSKSRNKFDQTKSPLDIDDENDIQIFRGDSTNRVAIQNCDWENLKAKDLL